MKSLKHKLAISTLVAITALQTFTTPTQAASNIGYTAIVENEMAGTPSARFVLSLINNKMLTASLRNDKALTKFLVFDPYLQSAFLKSSTYRETLTQGLSLMFLFSEPSGVREGYSIGQHTIRTLETFEEQQELYDISKIQIPYTNTSAASLLRYTLAFHDIGKSIAHRGGDKGRETRYSNILAYKLMRASGFTDADSVLAMNLIDQHQLIGSYVQGKMSLKQVTEEFHARAEYLRIKPADYFKMNEIIFIADAGSYPYLRQNAFNKVEVERANGKKAEKLITKDQDRYRLLLEAFGLK
ncbi:hypothetical protein D3C72_1080450 [compost metagenome]